MRATAETIRDALEARLKVDELLLEREQAYRRIAELETQVEELLGESGVFVFPLPPLPIAGFSKKIPVSTIKKQEVPAAPPTATATKSGSKNSAPQGNDSGE